jgi:F-box-like
MIVYLPVLGENSPIAALPDEILLTIFDFCRMAAVDMPYVRPGLWPEMWHKLVHVCQRWRFVVFSSPHRLDLRLYWTPQNHLCSSVEEMLDVWPPFPIEIVSCSLWDCTIAALEHNDRICQIHLVLTEPDMKPKTLAVMQKPFPTLTTLHLASNFDECGYLPALPVGFLEGSVPRLRSLVLEYLPPFPTLPQLLLSCNDLSKLHLLYMSDLSYIEAMVTALSALPRLTDLSIRFGPSGTIRHPPSPTRAVLPALEVFQSSGPESDLENFLARIDVPQLETLVVMYDQQPIFDIQQVITLSRTLGPFHYAKLLFTNCDVRIQLYQPEGTNPPRMVKLRIDTVGPGEKVSSLARICALLSSSLFSTVTELNIASDSSVLRRFSYWRLKETLMDNPEWLVLFHLFTAVQTVRLSTDLQPFIVSSLLGHTRESVTGVLPELQNLYLHRKHCRDEVDEQAIKLFITACENSDRPVTVHCLP